MLSGERERKEEIERERKEKDHEREGERSEERDREKEREEEQLGDKAKEIGGDWGGREREREPLSFIFLFN